MPPFDAKSLAGRTLRASWKPALGLLGLFILTALLSWGGPSPDLRANIYWPTRLSHSAQGQLLLSVYDEDPLAGAQVDLFQLDPPPQDITKDETERLSALLDGATIHSTTTDNGGVAVLKLPPQTKADAHGRTQLVVRVRHDGQERIFRHHYELAPAHVMALQTDRPLYKPGQRVLMRLQIADRDLGDPVSGEITWEVRDPRGNLILQKKSQASPAGIASMDMELASECLQGSYTLKATLTGAQSTSALIKVQPYRLPRYKVTLAAQSATLTPGEPFEATLQARTTYDEPVQKGQAQVEILYPRQGGGTGHASIEGTLGDKGTLPLRWPAPQDLAPGSRVSFQAVVTSDAGRAERGQMTVPVQGRSLNVELLSAGAEGWVAGMPNQAYILVKDAQGQAVEGARIALTVQEQNQEQTFHKTTDAKGRAVVSISPRSGRSFLRMDIQKQGTPGLRFNQGITARYRSAIFELDAPVAVQGEALGYKLTQQTPGEVHIIARRHGYPIGYTVSDAQGTGEIKLGPEARGKVRLDAYNPRGSLIASAPLWVRQSGDRAITVTPDKKTYQPGDQAKLDLSFPASPDKPGVHFGVVGVDEALFALKKKASTPLWLLMREPHTDLSALRNALRDVEQAGQQDALGRRMAASRFADALSIEDARSSHGQDITHRLMTHKIKPWRVAWLALLSALMLVLSVLAARNTWKPWRKETFTWKRLGIQALIALGTSLLGGLMLAASPEFALGGLSVWILVILGWLLGAMARGFQDKATAWLGWTLAMIIIAACMAMLADATSVPEGMVWVMLASLILPALLLMAEVFLWSLALVHHKHSHAGWGMSSLWGVLGAALLGSLMVTLGVQDEAGLSMQKMAMEQERRPAPPPIVDADEPAQSSQQTSPRLRSWFPETMLWMPEVKADKEGNATVSFRIPDSLTTWRLEASASTTDGRFGHTQMGLKVWQPFFVELELPTQLTQGDRVFTPLALVNRTQTTQKVTLQTQTTGSLTLRGAPKTVTLAPDTRQVLKLEIAATGLGKGNVEITATGQDQVGDALRRSLDVVPDGRQRLSSRAGIIAKGWTSQAIIPSGALPGTGRTSLTLYPGLSADAAEGLEAMLRMPSGCFEQTSSANYPNVLLLRMMCEADPKTWPGGEEELAKAREEAEDFVSLGVQKMVAFQGSGGGFRLYPDSKYPEDVMLTAYGLMQLAQMRTVHPLDPEIMERAATWLVRKQNTNGTWPIYAERLSGGTTRSDTDPAQLRSTAFVAWSLLQTPQPQRHRHAVDRALEHLIKQAPEATSPDTLALITLALHQAGRTSDAAQIARKLVASVHRDGDLAWWKSTQSTWIGGLGHSADVEATSLAVFALLRTETQAELLGPTLRYLLSARSGRGGWGSTQATVWALQTLEQVRAGQSKGPVTLGLQLDKAPWPQAPKSLTFAKGHQALHRQEVPNSLAPGPHPIQVTPSTGKTSMMAQIVTRYAAPWGSGLATIPDERISLEVNTTTRTISRGKILDITVFARNLSSTDYGATIVELPLPPGGFVDTSTMERWTQSGTIDRFEVLPTHVRLYLPGMKSRSPQAFSYQVVALLEGTMALPPARAYVFYAPDPVTEVNAGKVTIRP